MNVFSGSTESQDDETHWLSVADLMAGLMMVFLFIAVALMRFALIERDRIKEIAVAYQQNQLAIYQVLQIEFENDLKVWDAEIEKDSLTFTFNSPEIQFARGSDQLTVKYQLILSDFFPRYLTILEEFRDSIDEIRIEGHTSSRWGQGLSASDSYFKNMDLSQRRTRSVLKYVYQLPSIATYRGWIETNMAAVGLSSAKIRLTDAGAEDVIRSRRVSFRVVTKADLQIKKILDI